MIKKAIVACNSTYCGLPVTAHYYARWLAQVGFDVLFISAPLSPFHALNLSDSRIRQRFAWWRGGIRKETNRISSMVPLALFTPRDFWPLSTVAAYENWSISTIPLLTKAIRRWTHGHVSYLYLEAPVFLPLLKLTRPSLSIYRLPDMLGSFHRKTAPLLRVAAKVAQEVDLTVYASSSYMDQVSSLKPRAAAHLPNGVELSAFTSRPALNEPRDIASLPKPRIVFVGEIGARIELSLLSALAQKFPYASVILIGSFFNPIGNSRVCTLLDAPNIHFLGAKPYDSLSTYLNACDVGIVPFKFDIVDKFIAHSNPLKIYQYLACGLPVVSTRTPALERIDAPIHLASNEEEFLSLVQTCLMGETEAKRSARKAYAKQHSFETQIEVLFHNMPEHDPRNLL